MANLLQRLEIAKDFAQTAFENTLSAVQGVHTTIADTSYNILNQGVVDAERLNTLKAKHDASASQVYDAIREVNRSLGQLASDYFETLEDSAYVSDVMTKNSHPDKNKTDI